MKTILGKKMGMTQIFTEAGAVVPVTVVEAGPVTVTQVKTVETDGYDGVQVGFIEAKPQRVNKPMTGHFAKNDLKPMKYLAEFRPEEGEAYEVGQQITVADFEVGSKLDVTGTSKGKGTQGNIKRHGHHRGPMSHGSKHKRLAGALAAGTYPSRVFKGNAGPGRMGRETVTVQNVELVKVIEDRNLMLIKGAVPGNKGGIVRIQYAVKGQDK
ncbi:MAG: 50S ribosomal protein L3 [Firmicutes bacterium]|nr:50S ribosomal protein L3 [Bacillota bacterium]